MNLDALKNLGWSQELVDAAEQIANGIRPYAVTDEAEELHLDYEGGTVTASTLNVSGAPVASEGIFVAPRRR